MAVRSTQRTLRLNRQPHAKKIGRELIRRGKAEHRKPFATPEFTPDPAANALVTDLAKHPHAYVVACLMDRQIKAERAWEIPYRLQERLGTFELQKLRGVTAGQLTRVMRKPTNLHRYPDVMARNIFAALQLIDEVYGGDAGRIWSERPSSAAVVLRFLEFPGAGPKIATMATNLLVRLFKVPMSDYYSIDISVDVHVRRLLTRLGLVAAGAPLEHVVYAARALSPAFPGIVDSPAFRLGREVCRPQKPKCDECYLERWCPRAEA